MSTLLNYLPILIVVIIYVVRMKEVGTKREVVKGEIKEKVTFRFFMISGLITILGGIAEFILSGFNWSWWTLILGVLLAITSFKVRWSAISALGKFWSLHNEVRDNHEFVQSGPFRWMRHPTYFSMILELLCGVIILNAPFSAFFAFLVFFPTLYYRIKYEEALLTAKFGESYLTYKKTRYALIPTWPK